MFSYRERSAKSFSIKIQSLNPLESKYTESMNTWMHAGLKFHINLNIYMKN